MSRPSLTEERRDPFVGKRLEVPLVRRKGRVPLPLGAWEGWVGGEWEEREGRAYAICVLGFP